MTKHLPTQKRLFCSYHLISFAHSSRLSVDGDIRSCSLGRYLAAIYESVVKAEGRVATIAIVKERVEIEVVENIP